MERERTRRRVLYKTPPTAFKVSGEGWEEREGERERERREKRGNVKVECGTDFVAAQ